MSGKSFIVILTVLTILSACKDNKSETETLPLEVIVEKVDSQKIQASDVKIIYAWVDKLRLRNEPNTRGDIVAELNEGQELIYLDQKTNFTEKVSLRGQIYDEPWLQVKTDKDETGWVYGGGVKFYKPRVDLGKSPYDKCQGILMTGKFDAAKKCRERIQKEQLAKDRQYVDQDEKGITFNLLSGDKKIVKNIEEGTIEISGELPAYEYRYYIPQMGYFVVQYIDSDKGTYLLVNDKSGKEIPIWGYPKPSPDHQYLLVTNASPKAEPEKNGVQILAFTDEGFTVIFQQRFEEYALYVPKWLDDTHAEITLVPTEENIEKGTTMAELMLDKTGHWQVALKE